jgi:hypothetical protein
LGAVAAGGGQGVGGQGYFGGADEAVELFLWPGAAVEVRAGVVVVPDPVLGGAAAGADAGAGALVVGPRGRCRGGAGGAGVGGGVHDGEEVFVLVGGGEDFEVVQAVAGFADECALGVAEGFFAGFGAVGVDGVGPAAGDAGEEVRVGGRCCGGEVLFDEGQFLGGGEVLEPVQGEGDDGPGAGRNRGEGSGCALDSVAGTHGVFAVGAGVSDGVGPGGAFGVRSARAGACGGEGGGEVFAGCGDGVAGEGGGGQDVCCEGEAAVGFAFADPEPLPEELGGVGAAVIGR